MLNKLNQLNELMRKHSPEEGYNPSSIEGFGIYKSVLPNGKIPALYEPLICVLGQGEKKCHVGDKTYQYKGGDYLISSLPVPVELEIVSASMEQPMLAAAIGIDLARIADLLMKIERIGVETESCKPVASSSIFTGKAEDELIDSFLRLLKASEDKQESEILGQNMIDEIYYRILSGDSGSSLKILLNQRGDIQRISRVVEHIHSNLEKSYSMDDLAGIIYMSKTSFFETFKKVMNISPLQYIKSIRLHKAQVFLKEGRNAKESGYMVGYNSVSQFSREYKRYFGFSPSAT